MNYEQIRFKARVKNQSYQEQVKRVLDGFKALYNTQKDNLSTPGAQTEHSYCSAGSKRNTLKSNEGGGGGG